MAAAVGGIAGAIGSGIAANKARAFQKKVLKNQIQWKVADLRKAGLNPILAAGGFGGGGAPGGVMSQMPDFGGLANTAKDVESKGKLRKEEGALKSEQRQMTSKQIEMIDAQILNTNAQTGVHSAQSQKLMADTMLAINNQNRWQPLADVGNLLSTGATGPARDWLGKTMQSIEGTTGKDVKSWLKSKGLYNDKWSDNWRTTK